MNVHFLLDDYDWLIAVTWQAVCLLIYSEFAPKKARVFDTSSTHKHNDRRGPLRQNRDAKVMALCGSGFGPLHKSLYHAGAPCTQPPNWADAPPICTDPMDSLMPRKVVITFQVRINDTKWQ